MWLYRIVRLERIFDTDTPVAATIPKQTLRRVSTLQAHRAIECVLKQPGEPLEVCPEYSRPSGSHSAVADRTRLPKIAAEPRVKPPTMPLPHRQMTPHLSPAVVSASSASGAPRLSPSSFVFELPVIAGVPRIISSISPRVLVRKKMTKFTCA